MAKLNLVNQEMSSNTQTAVAEAPTPPTPTDTAKPDETKANENFLTKNKNLLLLGVVLVGGYFLYKNKMK
jgi:hypothetical protein